MNKRSIFPLALVVVGVAGAVIPSMVGSILLMTLLTQATISGILATSVGFMVRQIGLVSFGMPLSTAWLPTRWR
jgi:branched-chain amino acid transport system permease protein